MGPGGGESPVFSRAPDLIEGEDEDMTKRSRREPGGGGPPVSSRDPSLMMEEDRMRWGS